VLGIIVVGSVWILVSVGAAIAKDSRVLSPGENSSADTKPTDLHQCFEEIAESSLGLSKHLESFHRLLGHYDKGEAQQWANAAARWRLSWKRTGASCQFDSPTRTNPGPLAKEFEQLAALHAELGTTESIYRQELIRFGVEQAPRLDRIRTRLEAVQKRLSTLPR